MVNTYLKKFIQKLLNWTNLDNYKTEDVKLFVFIMNDDDLIF